MYKRQVEGGALHVFEHLDPGGQDQVDDTGLNALESIGHHRQLQKAVEEERNKVDEDVYKRQPFSLSSTV